MGPGQTATPVNAEIGLEAAPPCFLILLGAVYSDPAGDRQEMKTELRVGISGPHGCQAHTLGHRGHLWKGTSPEHCCSTRPHTCTHRHTRTAAEPLLQTTTACTREVLDLMAGLISCDIPKTPFFIKQFLKSFMTP